MKPERLPHPDSLIPLVKHLSKTETDSEIAVLRAHLVVERLLYSVLALRLNVEAKQLPSLQFFPLAKLALCGGGASKDTLLQVLSLNDLRNGYSHEITTEEAVTAAIATFAERTGILQAPPSSDIRLRKQKPEIQRLVLREACIACVTSVWMQLGELLILQKQYSSDTAHATAVKALDDLRMKHATRRKEVQASLRS